MKKYFLLALLIPIFLGCSGGVNFNDDDIMLAIDTIQYFIEDDDVNAEIDYWQALYADNVDQLVELYNQILDRLIDGIDGDMVDGVPTRVKMVD